jgi:type II secretion system protein N
MDVTKIKEFIGKYASLAYSFAGETMKLPYAKTYLLLSAAFTVLFLVFTFPYDLVLRDQIRKIEPALGNGIYVGVIDFSLLGDSYIDEMDISLHSGALLSLRDFNFNIAINPVTTLINRTLKGGFTIHRLNYTNNETSFTGVVGSDFNIRFNEKTGFPSDGILKASLQNISLKGLNIKGFDIPAVQFASIKADAVLANNELKINSILFDGADLRGSIRGSVTVAQFLGNSALNLSIELDPQSRIFENYKILMGSVKKSDDDRIRIPVTGTLASPKADFPWNSAE